MNKRYNEKAGNMSYTGHTHDNLYCWEITTTFVLEAIKALELNTHLKEELTKHGLDSQKALINKIRCSE